MTHWDLVTVRSEGHAQGGHADAFRWIESTRDSRTSASASRGRRRCAGYVYVSCLGHV